MQTSFLSTELADVYFLFEIEQIRIPAHKYVLALASPTFKTMFYGSIPEEGDIKVVDASSAAFKQFLSTIYCVDVTITAEHVGKIMYLAEKYLIPGSSDVCDQFIRRLVSIDDIIVGFELAVQFNRGDLKKTLEEKINEQPKAAIESESMLKCSSNTLKGFLQNDYLMCYAKEFFDVCMKWAENSCIVSELDPSDMKNLKKELNECFYWIPFYMMKPTEIAHIAAKYKDLFDQDDLIDLLSIGTSVGPVGLKKFKNITCNAEVGVKQRKGFWVTNLPEEKKQWIQKQENAILIKHRHQKLLAINLSMIFHNGTEESKTLSGILTIYQQGGSGIEDEILLKQPIEIQCLKPKYYLSDEKIKLVRPVVLKPGDVKFQFDFDSSWENNQFFIKQMDGETPHIFKFLYYN